MSVAATSCCQALVFVTEASFIAYLKLDDADMCGSIPRSLFART